MYRIAVAGPAISRPVFDGLSIGPVNLRAYAAIPSGPGSGCGSRFFAFQLDHSAFLGCESSSLDMF